MSFDVYNSQSNIARVIPASHTMKPMKPYRTLPIIECGEPLLAIPAGQFLLTDPAPYAALGAPYGQSQPWMLRSAVLAALDSAQQTLQQRQPGWRLKLFDAYRPNAVQAFMVNHEFLKLSGGRSPESVDTEERNALWARTFRIWAEPSVDCLTPPPHSTGAALDVTLADGYGGEVFMGSPIDENSDRSMPDYFVGRDDGIHSHRQLLLDVMTGAGFLRHQAEWWHFSLGDQMWAWQSLQRNPLGGYEARYGRADLLPSCSGTA